MEDLAILVPHFVRKYNFRFQKLVTHVDPEVYQLFRQYTWPGNIRELEHALEAAMNLVDGDTLQAEHLPEAIVSRFGQTRAIQGPPFEPASEISPQYRHKLSSLAKDFPPLREALAKTEHMLIEQALQATEGNIQQAAKLLAIPRQTLQYKLSKQKE